MQRRDFVRNVGLGAIPVIGATLVSCESVNDANNSGNWTADFNIMKEIAGIEAVAINTYQAAIDSGLLSTANTATAELFKSHHTDHLSAYNAALQEKDWAPVSAVGVPADSRLAAVSSELDALQLALTLEFEAASFYYQKITQDISTWKVRILFANIFPMEMGHVVAFKSALGLTSPNGATGLFEDFQSGL
jgi:hypothetical protein